MKSHTNTAIKDLVCGMEVNSDDISMDYQGIHYAFCSEQCLQRFQSNPHLYIGFPGNEAPRQVGSEVIKTRTIKLAEPLPQELADKVTDYIEAMMGIQYMEIHEDCIEITYDLLQITESQIEDAIAEAGAALGDDWTDKIKRAFVHYMEDTEAVSLEARPGSMRGRHH
jgi:YHS domain-containing protein